LRDLFVSSPRPTSIILNIELIFLQWSWRVFRFA
jgi:hypothetical protein